MNINATLLGQAITFAILIWFTMKFVWPPLTSALDERAKKIADGLAAAERGKTEMEQSSKRAAEELRTAREKAAEIISQGEKRREELIEEAKTAAKAEGDRLLAGAKAEIDQEVSRAKETLRQRVAELSVAGAEKILQREVNPQVHADLLTSLKNQL